MRGTPYMDGLTLVDLDWLLLKLCDTVFLQLQGILQRINRPETSTFLEKVPLNMET